MNEIDSAAKSYTERIQERLPGAGVVLMRINSGQGTKMSVCLNGRIESEIIQYGFAESFYLERLDALVSRFIERRSIWERLGEMVL